MPIEAHASPRPPFDKSPIWGFFNTIRRKRTSPAFPGAAMIDGSHTGRGTEAALAAVNCGRRGRLLGDSFVSGANGSSMQRACDLPSKTWGQASTRIAQL